MIRWRYSQTTGKVRRDAERRRHRLSLPTRAARPLGPAPAAPSRSGGFPQASSACPIAPCARKNAAQLPLTAKLRLAMAAMGQPETQVGRLCEELGVTRQTLYRHVSPKGELRPDGKKLLSGGRSE